MAQKTQFSVTLPNKPGMLAHLCQKLAANEINLRAISVAETTDYGVVRFVAESPAKVRKMLDQEGLAFSESDVVLAMLTDKAGALGEAAARLAKAGVNINYVYSGAGGGKGKAPLVFGVSNIEKARKVLKS